MVWLHPCAGLVKHLQTLGARFAAAVIFPHDIGIISFDVLLAWFALSLPMQHVPRCCQDLYAIGTPLFLPQQEHESETKRDQMVHSRRLFDVTSNPRVVENMAYAHLVSTSNYPWYLLRQEVRKVRGSMRFRYFAPRVQEHSKLNYPVVSSGSAMPWDAGETFGANPMAELLWSGWNWQSCLGLTFSGMWSLVDLEDLGSLQATSPPFRVKISTGALIYPICHCWMSILVTEKDQSLPLHGYQHPEAMEAHALR